MASDSRILLDTNAIIGLLRDIAPELRAALVGMDRANRMTSVIVEAELLVGVAKGREPERRRQLSRATLASSAAFRALQSNRGSRWWLGLLG